MAGLFPLALSRDYCNNGLQTYRLSGKGHFIQFHTPFKRKFLVQTFTLISAKLRASWIKIYSKLAHCKAKTIPILEIKGLSFMVHYIKQEALLSTRSNNGKSNILLP